MFRITSDPIPSREDRYDPGAGGHCVFVGTVRNRHEGRDVERLEYEAYHRLAEKEGERILAEAVSRFGLIEADCVHRTGALLPGELAIRVSASSEHRDEAFQACRYIVDEVKSRVPIWKKEHFVDGDSGWVRCDHCCETAHTHESGKAAAVQLLPEIQLADAGVAEPAKPRRGLGVMLGLLDLLPWGLVAAVAVDRTRVVFPDWMRDHMLFWLGGSLLVFFVIHRALVSRYVTGDWSRVTLKKFYGQSVANSRTTYATQRKIYQEQLSSQPISTT